MDRIYDVWGFDMLYQADMWRAGAKVLRNGVVRHLSIQQRLETANRCEVRATLLEQGFDDAYLMRGFSE